MMSGLVSIIMPSYNTAPYIAESIRSVMAQTYTDWELIVVDDASTDNTDEVVASCHSREGGNLLSSKIHYLKNDRNRGAAYSRNRALCEARGKYIAFLDSDDLWATDKLEKQIAFMTKNGYAFSYTRYEEMDENGTPTGTIVSGPKRITKTGMYNYCWPGCLTVMYDREVVGDIQIAEIQKNNDYAMWLKICRKADCYLLDENLARYRKRTGSITHACHPERSEAKSKDLSRHLSLIKWHYKLYREAEGMNPVVSLFNTGRNLFFGVWKKMKYVKR
ncbi:MAG: glycosyltransferase [Fibrobacter sp.]|nr:glycosyltransferase [Fibrobacter sp.]